MKRFWVTYEVRAVGSIGTFWPKWDVVEADDVAGAREAFREKWAEEYEFRALIAVKEMT